MLLSHTTNHDTMAYPHSIYENNIFKSVVVLVKEQLKRGNSDKDYVYLPW